MKKSFIFLAFFTNLLYAATYNNVTLVPITLDLHDKEKLQRGARMYMNYCSGCHSLKYMRYNRMAKDLGLTTFDGDVDKDLLVNNLIFTQAKIHDPIRISMPPADAQQWFGIVPPDLSLVTRSRGASWVYTYLKSFYADKTRPFGTNNLLISQVAMPNVLAPLAGEVIALPLEGALTPQLRLVEKGAMSEFELDSALQDLVTFLAYVGEPAQLIRYKMGRFVLMYLLILGIAAYRLKKAYWKKIQNSPSTNKV